MKKFKLEIEMDNDAFEEADNGYEVARILNTVKVRVCGEKLAIGDAGILRDSNGNKVGEWKVMRSRK